ncbi:MAG: DNA repair photolyase [Flavobacteriales bacterium]|jgi:DNA repair photolyase
MGNGKLNHMDKNLNRGRGAQSNPDNKFASNTYKTEDAYKNHCHMEEEPVESNATTFIQVHPKTVLSKNTSKDLSFDYSINPYQGCEHGCVYCYARNSHQYWGYGPGKDFETKILYKSDAAELLTKAFKSKSWKPQVVLLSGNTDCYQPLERKLGITRELLRVFLRYRNPVSIITKNSLVLRDLDLLKELNELGLLRMTLSITTLLEDTRRKMEPRTASVKQRLKTLEILTKNGILVNVNLAPIIPGINSHEVFDLVKAVAQIGANSVTYIIVRLNGEVGAVFEEWVKLAFPERAEKVLMLIKETHEGKLNESKWGTRMTGSGSIADSIRNMVQIASRKYVKNKELPPLNTSMFVRNVKGQMFLFEET